MKISEILERERKSENGREAVEYNRERESKYGHVSNDFVTFSFLFHLTNV
jgi:hypothetical protein